MSKASNLSTQEKKLTKEERSQRLKERNEKIEELIGRDPGWISSPTDYWEACWALTYIIGDIATNDKLVSNYRNPTTRHSVKAVVEDKKFFPEGPKSVKIARVHAFARLCKLIDDINWYSCKRGLEQLTIIPLLSIYENLKVREKARKYILRHQETGHPPFELDELPNRDFPAPRT
ncbi:hypothetical protein IKG06_03015 [Candidatus Saccharibacteria bacterium]|nr:hypothetical protein [Candidatus Saccharibacteria bacterium]